MNSKRIYLSLLFFLFFSYSKAAIIYVDNDSQGTNNGQTWANAYHNLQTALTNANFGDIIRMDKGTYIAPNGGFVLKDGVKIYGGYNVRYDNNGNIIPEWLINATRFFDGVITTVSGNSTFAVSQNLSSESILDGMTLKCSDVNYPVISLSSNVEFATNINNCIFKDARVGIDFARYNQNYSLGLFSPSINNCIFYTDFGIDIFSNGNNTNINLEVSNTKFMTVNASISFYNRNSVSGTATININNCSLNGGSPVRWTLDNITANVIIDNSLFGNVVHSALFNYNYPLGVYSPSNVEVNNTTFYRYDAALYSNVSSNIVANFNNCLFWDGQYAIRADSGIYTLNNCLLYNLNNLSCQTPNNNETIICNNSLYNQNPQFVSTNPASPNYLKLSANSPARNAGDNAYAIGTAYGGNSRILEGTVDIGAYEFCPDGVNCQGTIGGGGTINPRKISTKHLENTTNDLLVYPNPIQDVVKVKSKEKILSIEILNVQGQIISTVKNSNTIKLNNVAKGMYLLKVTTEKGIQTKRIVKE